MIPFSPPRIDDRTVKAVEDVLRSGWITTGPRTKEFEQKLAAYCGVDRMIALNSWTNACELVLRWYGIGPGDEVILPAYTYCATANIVMHVGAKPVLVDVLDDLTMDPEAVRRAMSPRTKCIIPVDVGGLPARIDKLLKVAMDTCSLFTPKVNLRVAGSNPQMRLGRALLLSDAAHSFGARMDGVPVGRQADITGFSFHAVKNLTTAEGGALAFNLPEPFDHQELYDYFNTMSLHGQSKDALAKMQPGAWRYDVTQPGFKCNMTDIQAAIGMVELERYERETLPRRSAICTRYSAAFANDPAYILPTLEEPAPERERSSGEVAVAGSPRRDTPGVHRRSSFHLYMLRIAKATEAQRDAIIEAIARRKVSVNVHFIPIPMLSYYKGQGMRMEDYPNTYLHYSREISLPVYFDLTDEQVDEVVKAVKAALREVMGEG